MAKKRGTDAKRAKDHDQKLQRPNAYLETQREHKKWYNVVEMGKQRGKPHAVPKNVKKRKEK